jgi:hypothetical protein
VQATSGWRLEAALEVACESGMPIERALRVFRARSKTQARRRIVIPVATVLAVVMSGVLIGLRLVRQIAKIPPSEHPTAPQGSGGRDHALRLPDDGSVTDLLASVEVQSKERVAVSFRRRNHPRKRTATDANRRCTALRSRQLQR